MRVLCHFSHLLQQLLGENAKTFMVANVSGKAVQINYFKISLLSLFYITLLLSSYYRSRWVAMPRHSWWPTSAAEWRRRRTPSRRWSLRSSPSASATGCVL